jgi:tetratricopeptide (TPR) repeat protein
MRALLAFATAGCCSIAIARGQLSLCQAEQHQGKLQQASDCYRVLTRAPDAFSRAEGYFGLQQYEDANNQFREADAEHPNSAQIKTEWGRLFAAHAQPGDAAKLFEEAIAADANYAPAYLNLARVLSENFDKRAVELAQAALAHNPTYAEADEFLAYLALEDSNL